MTNLKENPNVEMRIRKYDFINLLNFVKNTNFSR